MKTEQEIKEAYDLLEAILDDKTNGRIPYEKDRDTLTSFAAALAWTLGASGSKPFSTSLNSLKKLVETRIQSEASLSE